MARFTSRLTAARQESWKRECGTVVAVSFGSCLPMRALAVRGPQEKLHHYSNSIRLASVPSQLRWLSLV